MPKAIFTIGISSSGKSTWAFAHEKHGYKVLDSDLLRLELYGDETDQRDPHKVFDLMYKRGREYLEAGYDTIFCSTNLNMRYRIHAINMLRSVPNISFHAVIFNTPLDICRMNNELRENRHAPDWLFEKQIKQFQPPVKNEGWDEIEIVTPVSYDKDRVSKCVWRDVKCMYSQHNPHHTLSLYDHMLKCGQKVGSNEIIMVGTAVVHDIGKPYTRTYDEKNIAHYYGHENYGAYLCMNIGMPLEVIQLVAYHMLPYDSHAIPTWRKRLGDELWNKILVLHEADEAAK